MKSAMRRQVIPIRLLARLVAAAISTSCVLPVWGQWNGTNPVWTNSNVGIGFTLP